MSGMLQNMKAQWSKMSRTCLHRKTMEKESNGMQKQVLCEQPLIPCCSPTICHKVTSSKIMLIRFHLSSCVPHWKLTGIEEYIINRHGWRETDCGTLELNYVWQIPQVLQGKPQKSCHLLKLFGRLCVNNFTLFSCSALEVQESMQTEKNYLIGSVWWLIASCHAPFLLLVLVCWS